MEIKLMLFGITREIFGNSEETVKINKHETVGEFLENMKLKYPALAELSSILVAVNNEYAEKGLVLVENDEVALIPPVSGG